MDLPVILGTSEGIIKILLAVLVVVLGVAAYLERRYSRLFQRSKARFREMFPPAGGDAGTDPPKRGETPHEVSATLRSRAEIIMNLKPRSLRRVMLGMVLSLAYVASLYVLALLSGHLERFFHVEAVLVWAVKGAMVLVFVLSIALAHGIGGVSAQRRSFQRQLIGFHQMHSAVERARGNWRRS